MKYCLTLYFILQKQLVEYKRKNGDCLVLFSRPTGRWVHDQKVLQSLIGSATPISSEEKRRLDLLNKIGFFRMVNAMSAVSRDAIKIGIFQ